MLILNPLDEDLVLQTIPSMESIAIHLRHLNNSSRASPSTSRDLVGQTIQKIHCVDFLQNCRLHVGRPDNMATGVSLFLKNHLHAAVQVNFATVQLQEFTYSLQPNFRLPYETGVVYVQDVFTVAFPQFHVGHDESEIDFHLTFQFLWIVELRTIKKHCVLKK